jgi:hypothetical protein
MGLHILRLELALDSNLQPSNCSVRLLLKRQPLFFVSFKSNLSFDILLLNTDMRQKAIIALSTCLLAGLLLSACEVFHCNCYCSNYSAEELKLNEVVELGYSDLYCNSKNEFRLSFDSIMDSRCPIGAECIWEGNARVKIRMQQSGQDPATFWLDTHVGFVTDTVVHGLRFELTDVLPYPEVGKDYQLDDYIVQMIITD